MVVLIGYCNSFVPPIKISSESVKTFGLNLSENDIYIFVDSSTKSKYLIQQASKKTGSFKYHCSR